MLRLYLPELIIVRDLVHDFLDVVRLVGVIRNQRVERHLHTVGFVRRWSVWRLLAVIRGQIVYEASHHEQGFNVIFVGAIAHTRFGRMRDGAAKFFGGDNFVRDGFHDVGSGHEHVRRVFDHENKVGHCRRVNGTTCARPHDDGNLRHDA